MLPGSENGLQRLPVAGWPCPGRSCEELDGKRCTKSATCYYYFTSCMAYTCNCYQGHLVCP